MKFTTIKRLGLPSGLIAAVLAVSSCAEIAMVPAAVVAVPLVAVFLAGFVGVATLSQVMEGFDAQEREREAKPRKDGPFIEYWVNGKKSAVGTYKNKKLLSKLTNEKFRKKYYPESISNQLESMELEEGIKEMIPAVIKQTRDPNYFLQKKSSI